MVVALVWMERRQARQRPQFRRSVEQSCTMQGYVLVSYVEEKHTSRIAKVLPSSAIEFSYLIPSKSDDAVSDDITSVPLNPSCARNTLAPRRPEHEARRRYLQDTGRPSSLE